MPIGVVGIALALRILPETYDPHAGTEVDWGGMATLGGAVFCLTFGLVEGNQRAGARRVIVGLFVATALLLVAFALTQRYGRYPMLTSGLVQNRQFVGASTSLVLFGIGMMGTLFLTVLLFVNLWELLGARGGARDHPGGGDRDAGRAVRRPHGRTGFRRARSACPPCS